MFEPPRALTLPTLVAELRVALIDPDATEERRAAAAAILARLAAEGVPGADPDSWWGCRRCRTTGRWSTRARR
ncbi:hypothetical protein GCM10027610_131500 [Dactylosporangium cerinum]